MKKVEIIVNGKGEFILYSSLKEELKKQGINLTKKKIKNLGYRIIKINPIAFL